MYLFYLDYFLKMGSSQENKDFKNLSNINIENIDESILDISFEIDIYICGNYDNNFFQNNLITNLRFPEKPNIKYYEIMAKHKDIKDWHFFFAPKDKN